VVSKLISPLKVPKPYQTLVKSTILIDSKEKKVKTLLFNYPLNKTTAEILPDLNRYFPNVQAINES
jgi:hypothetical protein